MAELSHQAQAVLDSTMGLAATVREAQAVATAKRFGVSRQHISKIANRKSWTHI